MKTFEDALDAVKFALQCLDQDSIQRERDNITTVMHNLSSNAWLITRNIMMIDVKQTHLPFIVMCFDTPSVLYVNIKHGYALYYNPKSNGDVDGNEDVPRLVKHFVARTYPHIDGAIQRVRIQTDMYIDHWVLCCLFVTTISKSKYKDADCDCNCETLIKYVDKQCKDKSFVANFNDMCWDMVGAKKPVNISMVNTTAINTVSSVCMNVILGILHQVVKCVCMNINQDFHKFRSLEVYNKQIKASINITNEHIIKAWNQLNNRLKMAPKNVAAVKLVNVDIMEVLLVHYRYLLTTIDVDVNVSVSNNDGGDVGTNGDVRKIVDDINASIITIMDLRDDMNNLISKSLG